MLPALGRNGLQSPVTHFPFIPARAKKPGLLPYFRADILPQLSTRFDSVDSQHR